MTGFALAPTPLLHFGEGKVSTLPAIVKSFGVRVLLITGEQSFLSTEHGKKLLAEFQTLKLDVRQYWINQEPTPQLVDIAVRLFSPFDPNVVVAIGGGSVLDAGKAISAMLPLSESVKEYLEGVGSKPLHPGTKVPFIALPTTAGTGSEATKNAVLTEVGNKGFKKSLRHINFIPNIAIVDPSLAVSCPGPITASSGMDAFTQLLESFLSTGSNPITDALAYEGLTRIRRSLRQAYYEGSNLAARGDMAIAAYLSGITLANAGLGVVHGFASSIGGFFNIRHGVICSTLMAASNKITVRKLRKEHNNENALAKYEMVGKLFCGEQGKPNGYYIDALLALIEDWSKEMNIPGLAACGVSPSDFERIVNATENKSNPIALGKAEMTEVLHLAM